MMNQSKQTADHIARGTLRTVTQSCLIYHNAFHFLIVQYPFYMVRYAHPPPLCRPSDAVLQTPQLPVALPACASEYEY